MSGQQRPVFPFSSLHEFLWILYKIFYTGKEYNANGNIFMTGKMKKKRKEAAYEIKERYEHFVITCELNL